MKKLIALIVLFQIAISSLAYGGTCDWSTIKPMPNGDYEYSLDCHLKVGQLVQDTKIKDQQIQDLYKAVELKDLAIQKDDERVMLWQKTSDTQQQRLSSIESGQKTMDWLYFSLGALTVVASGFMAARLIGR